MPQALQTDDDIYR